ncbi:DDB1- and CUL4-associated factor 11 isoform X1 [Atheta coriaria]|uniref:DDB1- and CUL4-associated factor 11 isoform X1 n=1 Tax=Dalotia coriaria TaxID=877792 RepID=UPI0031F3A4BE
MGAFNSSPAMDVREILLSTSDSEDGSDSETNYALIFQRLIRRYGSSLTPNPPGEGFVMSQRRPRIKKFKPNTAKLDASEFYYMTKMDAGLGTCIDKSGVNVATLLKERECGKFRNETFSNYKRCRIANNYIPNKMGIFDHYDGKVFCGTFSEDGEYFITASQEHVIRVYKTNNGDYELIQRLNARDVGWSVIDVAFSPNNENFIYSTWSTSIHLCSVGGNPKKQEPLKLVNTARRFCVFSLAYSSDGQEILGGANDGVMFIYNLERNRRTLKISAHDFDVNTVKFADHSSHIIYSGSDDGLIKVWDRRTFGEEVTSKPVGVFAGHQDGITYIDAKGDGRYLISNSKDQSIKLWDVRMFSTEEAMAETRRSIHEQTWDYRWQTVPKRLSSLPTITGDTSVMTYKGHVTTRTLIRARFSPLRNTGQRYIYTGCGSGRLIIYDALTGKIAREERKHSYCVRDVSWHPHYNEIFTSSWDGTVGRWYYASKDEKPIELCPVLRRSSRIASRNNNSTRPIVWEIRRAVEMERCTYPMRDPN